MLLSFCSCVLYNQSANHEYLTRQLDHRLGSLLAKEATASMATVVVSIGVLRLAILAAIGSALVVVGTATGIKSAMVMRPVSEARVTSSWIVAASIATASKASASVSRISRVAATISARIAAGIAAGIATSSESAIQASTHSNSGTQAHTAAESSSQQAKGSALGLDGRRLTLASDQQKSHNLQYDEVTSEPVHSKPIGSRTYTTNTNDSHCDNERFLDETKLQLWSAHRFYTSAPIWPRSPKYAPRIAK